MIKYLFTILFMFISAQANSIEIVLNFTETAQKKMKTIFKKEDDKFLIANIRVSEAKAFQNNETAIAYFENITLLPGEEKVAVRAITETCRYDCLGHSLSSYGPRIQARLQHGQAGIDVSIKADEIQLPYIEFSLDAEGNFTFQPKLPPKIALDASENFHSFTLDYDTKYGFFFRES